MTEMTSSLNITLKIEALLLSDKTKEMSMDTAVISVMSLTTDSSTSKVLVFFPMLSFSTRWVIVIVVVPLPIIPRKMPFIKGQSKNSTVTAETIATVLSITNIVKIKAVGAVFKAFDMFKVKPLSKSTTTSANDIRNEALSRKNLPETTLKTGPKSIPISMRNTDSGILVLLKKKLPINPISMTIPKIKMPLLIVINQLSLIDLTLFFLM